MDDKRTDIIVPMSNDVINKKEHRIFSFGGGVQSVAVFLLTIEGKLQIDAFVYCDVGADSEKQETTRYIHDVIIPLSKAHNVPFYITRKLYKGNPDTVYKSVMRDNRSIPIPVRLQSGAYGKRTCTQDFKGIPFDRWVKLIGLKRVNVGIGFSIDEGYRIERKTTGWHTEQGKRKLGYERNYFYPLTELHMSRHDCYTVFEHHNLEAPTGSACFFCPFNSRTTWIDQKMNDPDTFQKSICVQNALRDKRGLIGKDDIRIHRDGILLEDVPAQTSFFDREYDNLDGGCETGYCGL